VGVCVAVEVSVAVGLRVAVEVGVRVAVFVGVKVGVGVGRILCRCTKISSVPLVSPDTRFDAKD
jgi:hypothetical protein